MKRKNSIAGMGAILLIATILFVSCGNKKDTSGTDRDREKVLNVGLVYSTGGKGDKGINDLMYHAMERISQKNGWNYSDLENESASNVEPSNRQFCEQGKDVIINFGFGCIDVVNQLALEYPEITFITIDAVPTVCPMYVILRSRSMKDLFL
jgi:basic membrane protein A